MKQSKVIHGLNNVFQIISGVSELLKHDKKHSINGKDKISIQTIFDEAQKGRELVLNIKNNEQGDTKFMPELSYVYKLATDEKYELTQLIKNFSANYDPNDSSGSESDDPVEARMNVILDLISEKMQKAFVDGHKEGLKVVPKFIGFEK